MYLAVLTTLAGLHFAIVAVYLITRKIDYPLWVYVAVALFCWWPPAILLVQFHAEKRLATCAAERTLAGDKFRLAGLTAVCSVVLQGFTAMYGRSAIPAAAGDVVPLFSAAASLLSTVVLLYALHLLQKKNERNMNENRSRKNGSCFRVPDPHPFRNRVFCSCG